MGYFVLSKLPLYLKHSEWATFWNSSHFGRILQVLWAWHFNSLKKYWMHLKCIRMYSDLESNNTVSTSGDWRKGISVANWQPDFFLRVRHLVKCPNTYCSSKLYIYMITLYVPSLCVRDQILKRCIWSLKLFKIAKLGLKRIGTKE